MLDKYKYNVLTDDQQSRINAIKEAVSELDHLISVIMINSRYKSLVLIHLETACMFATKGIALESLG